MTTTYAPNPTINPTEAVADALKQVHDAGMQIAPAAREELQELVLASFRRMQESRVLDLPSDDPDRRAREQLARDNLRLLVARWIEIERNRDSTELTPGGFQRAYVTLCPVYPCEG